MATYIVAVSGGVDSVVLLDMLAKIDHRLIVAHVDHGIRGEESAADARFVQALAKQYGLPYVSTELKLGAKASEEQARSGRYDFLFAQAKTFAATVVTAHHADDVVETVALNLTRGTGWRGLAVLDREDVVRPLLALKKQQLYEYALKHRLEWVEDATNHTPAYLRNRLRAQLHVQQIENDAVLALRARQLQLRKDIEHEASRLVAKKVGSRYFMTMLDDQAAMEVLGAAFCEQVGKRPERPRLLRALHAIRTGRAGARVHVGEGITMTLSQKEYTLEQ